MPENVFQPPEPEANPSAAMTRYLATLPMHKWRTLPCPGKYGYGVWRGSRGLKWCDVDDLGSVPTYRLF